MITELNMLFFKDRDGTLRIRVTDDLGDRNYYRFSRNIVQRLGLAVARAMVRALYK